MPAAMTASAPSTAALQTMTDAARVFGGVAGNMPFWAEIGPAIAPDRASSTRGQAARKRHRSTHAEEGALSPILPENRYLTLARPCGAGSCSQREEEAAGLLVEAWASR